MANKGLKLYRIAVIGISPMLQNPMTDDILDDLVYGAGRRKAPERDVSLEVIASKKVIKGPDDKFGIPTDYLFASLIEAGRRTIFEGKTKMSTLESSLIPAFLTIVPDVVNEKTGDGFLPFKDQSVKWVVDRRKGVLAANKAAVAVIRPKFPTWAFDVTVEIDEDQVNVTKIAELFNNAGRYSGLGDFRPSCRGQFGRFKSSDFVALEQSATEEGRQAA